MYDKLKKLLFHAAIWVKFIFLCLFVVCIGLILFYLFGKNSSIISFIRKILGYPSDETKQEAVVVKESNNNSKIDADDLSTNNVVAEKIKSIDSLLKRLEE